MTKIKVYVTLDESAEIYPIFTKQLDYVSHISGIELDDDGEELDEKFIPFEDFENKFNVPVLKMAVRNGAFLDSDNGRSPEWFFENSEKCLKVFYHICEKLEKQGHIITSYHKTKP